MPEVIRLHPGTPGWPETLPGRAWSGWTCCPDILTRAFEHGQTVSSLVLPPLASVAQL